MNTSWLEAVIKGQTNTANGVGAVENINLDGLYLRLRNQGSFFSGERVTIDLYLRDANRRYIILKMRARVVQTDERGARLHFNPMTLSQHRKLGALIDFMSAPEGSDKDRYEEILFTGLLEDYQTQ
jgi:hypothetical protein